MIGQRFGAAQAHTDSSLQISQNKMISARFPSKSGLKTRDAETQPHVCVPIMHESQQDKQDPISIRDWCISHSHIVIHKFLIETTEQDKQDPISIRDWCMSHNHDAIHVHTIAATVFIVTRSRPQPQGIVGGASFHLACG